MRNRHPHLLLLAILAIVAIVAGCKGPNWANSRTAKRAFNPPIAAQNDVLKVEVRKLLHKKRSLRRVNRAVRRSRNRPRRRCGRFASS